MTDKPKRLLDKIAERMKPKGADREVVCLWSDPVDPHGQAVIRMMNPVAALADSAAMILVEYPE